MNRPCNPLSLALACALAGVALAALVLPAPARAGAVSPSLQRILDRAPFGRPVSCIVHLAEQAPLARIAHAQKIRRAPRAERHREIVTALRETARSQQSLCAQLELDLRTGAVRGYTPYWISNLVVVSAAPDEVLRIAARGDVDWVEPNFRAELIGPAAAGAPDAPPSRGIGVAPGLRAIRADEVWREFGFHGEGTIVANLDTGVDGTHPALASRWRGRNHPWQECWLDVTGGGRTFPDDSDSPTHGTHVMGTLTGLGAETGDTVGVAWGAEWIASNGLGRSDASDNGILRAFQWFADPDGDPNTDEDVPDVVQNSWGAVAGQEDYVECDPRWWSVIDNCEAAGVTVTFSAGNEGPAPMSLRIPADRASTPTSSFAIGALNAHTAWPYPAAEFSSRGPTPCGADEALRIKPEVAAPGVDIYSSVGGGFYAGGWSGTSMAGPHAAGIVALMRQANPELDPQQIKEILMATARDEGPAGEDNTYGWGCVDAVEAVRVAMTGFGRVEGEVRNVSWHDQPVGGAEVRLLDTKYRFLAGAQGLFRGTAPSGSYRALALFPGLDCDTLALTLEPGSLTRAVLPMHDEAGPVLSTSPPLSGIVDSTGIVAIEAGLEDPSSVAAAALRFRFDDLGHPATDWTDLPMEPVAGTAGLFRGELSGIQSGTRILYFIVGWDGRGTGSVWPTGGPEAAFAFEARSLLYATGFENGPEPGWQGRSPGDDAISGRWIQCDPVGTRSNGRLMQPEDAGEGQACFVTGNGTPGEGAGTADVDRGCTTLLSPPFSFERVTDATVRYRRWFGADATCDDTLCVDVTPDEGGRWLPVERVTEPDTVWHSASFRIGDACPLTGRMRFRFRICDGGVPGIIEAGIDAFSVETFTPAGCNPLPPRPAPEGIVLLAGAPNPYRPGKSPEMRIRFALAFASDVRLEVYDAAGRRIRRLLQGRVPAGERTVSWDARDDQGRAVASGIYVCRLRTGAAEQSRRLIVLR